MKLYSENKNYKLYEGSMLDMLEVIEPNTIDSIITDPPYELNFMNKGWDNSGIAFQKETWQKCYEVLKPGGYLLAFGGSRTFHRIACAIEDAGFEIRDTIMWLYGSGFPKSMALGKAIDKKEGNERIKTGKIIHHAQKGVAIAEQRGAVGGGSFGIAHDEEETIGTSKWEGWGTALKPSFEPIIVARKPFKGSCVDNVIEYGVGGINIDECRVLGEDKEELQKNWTNRKTPAGFNGDKSGIYGSGKTDNTIAYTPNGRFPANTILTYDETDYEEVCGGFPNTKSGGNINFDNVKNDSIYGSIPNRKGFYQNRIDSGSASRYFYCAKASKKDRDEGLDEFEEKNMRLEQNREIHSAGCEYIENGKLKQNPHLQSSIKRNIHPTVKPTELMQYLVRLVSPNGATILDPFNGSGSTGKAVMYENKERNKNYKYIGIELTEEYLPIAKARIEYVCNLKEEELKEAQLSIFTDVDKMEQESLF